jgi:RsmE family RNA methyltransferase
LNVILFDSDSPTQVLPRTDPRALHLLNVLKCKTGDQFDMGVINGSMGKGMIQSLDESEIVIGLSQLEPSVALDDIHFIIGLPRPQTARKILSQLSSLGVASMDFVLTETSDRSYARSNLWTSGEWGRHLVLGAEQAFTTSIPEVCWGNALAESGGFVRGDALKIVLDNYEGVEALGETALTLPLVIAVGPERGWSARDRETLIDKGFHMVHLGTRVLRVETACVAAYSIAKSKLGLM